VTGYKLQPEAEKDLEDIWNYTVEKWGVEQAIRYVDELDLAFQLLARTPLISRERVEFTPPVRIHHHKKHLIVYLVRETNIIIVRVLHDSMEVETQLREDE